MKYKELTTFTIPEIIEADETSTEKDSTGAEIKVTKKVKKETPRKFTIIRPNRALNDEADFFFAKTLSKYVKEGLLTIDMLQKRISDDGGILSKVDVENYQELLDKINEIQLEFQKLSSDNPKEEDRSEDVKKQLKELEEKFKLFNEVKGKFEIEKQALYEHTAEFKARNKSIFWWALFLAYYEDDKGKLQPYFPGETFDEKLNHYDLLVEKEDEFTNKVIRRFTNLTTIWNTTGETKKEELEKSLEFMEKQ